MDKISLIDAFFREELEADQLVQFENKLKDDLEFKRLFEERKEVLLLLKKSKAIELKEELASITKEHHSKNQQGSTNILKYVIAAALSAIVLYMAYSMFLNKQEEPKQIYAEVFEVYPMDVATRGEPLSELSQQAKSFYDQENYNEVIPVLKEIIAHEEYDGKWYLYLASAYYKTDQFQLAIESLNQIITRQDQLYLDKAQEYLKVLSASLE